MKEPLLDSILRDVDDPAEQEMLRKAWNELKAFEQAEPSPGLARRFAQTIEFSRGFKRRIPSLGRRLLPFAAVLVVGVAIGGIFPLLSSFSNEDVQLATSQADTGGLGRAVSVAFEPYWLAARRLDAVEVLAGLPGDPEIGRILTEVASTDPSIGVRLVAIDAIEPYVNDDEVARRLIQAVLNTDSALVRIRLIELFVDHRIETARPEIKLLQRDPRVDELVRDTARWAIDRL